MNLIINFLYLAMTVVKLLFTPPVIYYTLLGIAGGLTVLIKKHNI